MRVLDLKCVHSKDTLRLTGPDSAGDYMIEMTDAMVDMSGSVWIRADELRKLFAWAGVVLHTGGS